MTPATPKPHAGEHTKGPWRYSVNVGPTKGLLVEEDGSTILELANSTRSSRFERDIQRIVACVNACEGIPTTSLELGDTKQWIKEEIALRAERDLLRERERELVEALEKIASCHSAFDGDVVSIAYKALAKVQLKKLKARP